MHDLLVEEKFAGNEALKHSKQKFIEMFNKRLLEMPKEFQHIRKNNIGELPHSCHEIKCSPSIFCNYIPIRKISKDRTQGELNRQQQECLRSLQRKMRGKTDFDLCARIDAIQKKAGRIPVSCSEKHVHEDPEFSALVQKYTRETQPTTLSTDVQENQKRQQKQKQKHS